MGLESVKHIVLVLSGKGGVGKSSVTLQLALSLSLRGHSVGVLDVDLTGPSAPRMFAVEGAVVQQSHLGWEPVAVPDSPAITTASSSAAVDGATANDAAIPPGKITLMSIAFLLQSRSSSVVWRGPKKTAMVRQMLSDVNWGPLDYLLVDTPPGTSDEHIALAEVLQADPSLFARLRGAVVVTTPQAVATADVRKELNFCEKVGFPVLGVVENMSGYVCPHCAECTNIFSSGGGEVMAGEFGKEFLGRVPIEPGLVELVETQGGDLRKGYRKLQLFEVFKGITGRVVEKCEAARAGV